MVAPASELQALSAASAAAAATADPSYSSISRPRSVSEFGIPAAIPASAPAPAPAPARTSALVLVAEARENSNYLSAQETVFEVVLKPTPDAQRLGLTHGGQGLNARAIISSINITLTDPFMGNSLVSWPIRYLRR